MLTRSNRISSYFRKATAFDREEEHWVTVCCCVRDCVCSAREKNLPPTTTTVSSRTTEKLFNFGLVYNMEDRRSRVNNSWKAYWTITLLSLILLISSANCQQVTVQPGNITAVAKQSIELKCVFNEAVACSWQRDGLPLFIPNEEDGYTFSNRPILTEKSPDCSIKIASISEPDFAKWRCSTIGTNNKPAVPGPDIWISRQVTPSDPVIFFKGNTTNEIKLPSSDEPVNNLVCESQKGNPAPKLTWQLRGLEYLGQEVIRKEGPDLYSAKLTWDRGGGWQLFNGSKDVVCKASHPGFKYPKLATAILRSNYAPKRVEIWVEGYDRKDVDIGPNDKVVLACIADGQPSPTYTWEVWSVEDDLWKLVNNSEQNITINFELLGKYRCKASNDLNKYTPKASANEIIVYEKKAEVTSTGVIIGIVVGCVVVLMILILIFVYMKRKQKAASTPDKDGHAGGQDGRDPEAVEDSTEKTALSEPQQNGQEDKLNGKTETSPIKIDQNVNNKVTDEVVYAQLDLTQKDTAKVRTPTETEKTEYAEIRFNQENYQNALPA